MMSTEPIYYLVFCRQFPKRWVRLSLVPERDNEFGRFGDAAVHRAVGSTAPQPPSVSGWHPRRSANPG